MHVCVEEFKNKVPVQERHEELDESEQVKQLVSQLMHLGVGVRERNWLASQLDTHVLVED